MLSGRSASASRLLQHVSLRGVTRPSPVARSISSSRIRLSAPFAALEEAPRSSPGGSNPFRNENASFGEDNAAQGYSDPYVGGRRDYGQRRGDYQPRDRTADRSFYDNATNPGAPVEDVNSLRNVYKESVITAERSEQDIHVFRRQHEIAITGGGQMAGPPKPVLTFEELECVPRPVSDLLHSSNFTTPTPIQSQAWPAVLSGLDLIGVAQTGSGKTLAYILPAITHIHSQPAGTSYARGSPRALVLAPTRELAVQITTEADKFTRPMGMGAAAAYGGTKRYEQLANIRRGADILVATPGRLIDLVSSGAIGINKISYLVMDEADRMLDMGFEPQIRQIVNALPRNRQTLLWSATWPKEVQRLAEDFIDSQRYMHIQIGGHDLEANKDVTQKIELVDQAQKPFVLQSHLKRILTENPKAKVIIFVSQKWVVDTLFEGLANGKYPVASTHGDKSQDQRDRAINMFKSGRAQLLVTTDVCARGLDVKDVGHVINYDTPGNVEDYVHRIGRTGRAGNKGEAITFLTEAERGRAAPLVKIMQAAGQEIPLWLNQMARDSTGGWGSVQRGGGRRPGYGGGGHGGGYRGGRGQGMGMGMGGGRGGYDNYNRRF